MFSWGTTSRQSPHKVHTEPRSNEVSASSHGTLRCSEPHESSDAGSPIRNARTPRALALHSIKPHKLSGGVLPLSHSFHRGTKSTYSPHRKILRCRRLRIHRLRHPNELVWEVIEGVRRLWGGKEDARDDVEAWIHVLVCTQTSTTRIADASH